MKLTACESAIAVILCTVLAVHHPGTASADVTFEVCDVSWHGHLLDALPYSDAVEERIGEYEACSGRDGTLVPVKANALVEAVRMAYSGHRPLVLSPDIVWLCICQGFAAHVDENADSLRYRIVAHEGKQEIVIDVMGFTKGDPHNPWGRIFPVFCDSIRGYLVADLNPILLPTFTTTTPIEAAAFQVTFMDALDSYFSYTVRNICGIPSITLLGTPADWEMVLKHARELRQFDLDWWIDDLEPVLEQFVAASKGEIDKEFWGAIYSRMQTSDDPMITGWFLKLFPYLPSGRDAYRKSPCVGPEAKTCRGLYPDTLPSGIAKTDLRLIDCTVVPPASFPMEIMAGFIGVSQDPETMGLKPEIAWIVRDDPDAME